MLFEEIVFALSHNLRRLNNELFEFQNFQNFCIRRSDLAVKLAGVLWKFASETRRWFLKSQIRFSSEPYRCVFEFSKIAGEFFLIRDQIRRGNSPMSYHNLRVNFFKRRSNLPVFFQKLADESASYLFFKSQSRFTEKLVNRKTLVKNFVGEYFDFRNQICQCYSPVNFRSLPMKLAGEISSRKPK